MGWCIRIWRMTPRIFSKRVFFNPLCAKRELFKTEILEVYFLLIYIFSYLSIYFTTRYYTSFCSLCNRLSDYNNSFRKYVTWYVHKEVKGQVSSNFVIFAPFQYNYQNYPINCLISFYFYVFMNL